MDLYLSRELQFSPDRIEHFAEGKKLLVDRFVPWLIRRILKKIDEGFDVYLVIDSGTTLYFAFRTLQRKLIQTAEVEP